MMDEVQNPAIPSDMHHHQNRLESSRLKIFEIGAKKNICSSEEKVTRGWKKHDSPCGNLFQERLLYVNIKH
jgi:hypothetical protein